MSVVLDYTGGVFAAKPTGGSVGTDPASIGDANFGDVSLLLHMDGTNGSTTFTDSSSNAVSVATNGNAQISTAQSKFGSASGYFDGTGDYLTTPYVTTDYDWWTSDFTLEAWVYPTTFTGWYRFYSSLGDIGTLIGNMDPTGGSTDWTFGITSSGAIRLYYYNGGAVNTPASTETVSLNQWNHIAVVKDINGYKYFVNGVGGSYNSISGTPQSNASLGLAIGQFNSVGINGYVDDLRITKGTARYTSTFTPPTAAFSNIGPTLDLSTGNTFVHAPSANVAYAFSNPPASGTAIDFTLKVTPSATVTITWPSSVKWAGGTAPSAPASGETDAFTFYSTDGGSTYYGFHAGDAYS
jgi:hypothetical protein